MTGIEIGSLEDNKKKNDQFARALKCRTRATVVVVGVALEEDVEAGSHRGR